jgi:hypothetical protein
VLNDRSKHIDVKFHVVREYENTRKLEVELIDTTEQPGDILTKPLGRLKFQELSDKIRICQVTLNLVLASIILGSLVTKVGRLLEGSLGF